MSIPIEVPGLDTIVPDLGSGRLVLVESGPDSAKNFFVRRIGLTAARAGEPVTFVTSRDRGELIRLFASEGGRAEWSEDRVEVVEENAVRDLDGLAERGGLLAVDSFSFLTYERTPVELAAMLRSLRTVCHARGTTALLATDRGMLESRSEAVVTHLSDGMIEFHAKEGPEGVIRFLRVPKWVDGRFVDRNMYYEFDGKRIAIDLRRRVL
jgi:KaiC/GvpD/RAD55 family RecA-like ATPase